MADNQPVITEKYLFNREKWNRLLQLSKNNPSIMMRVGLDYLESESKGELDFVDASTPAALLMEFSATLAANNFTQFQLADKKHYPVLATEYSDLYAHMSNELYEGRFAVPSISKFWIKFIKNEILSEAVPIPNSNIRKILLPRGSKVAIDGLFFTLLHGIEIRVSPFGGIDVVYDTEHQDSYQRLSTNILEYFYARDEDDNECLFIEVDIMQLDKTWHACGLTHNANIFVNTFDYKDQFIKARVYLQKNEEGELIEIRTTHSEQVYDPNHITARLKVLSNNRLQVDIPLIYYDKSMLQEPQVFVEIYTTKGAINVPLKAMSESTETPINASFDNSDHLSVAEFNFSEPLQRMNFSISVRSDTIGGMNERKFEEIKEWTIHGGKVLREDAITLANIKTNSRFLGYDISVDVDNLSGRIFKCSKELEPDGTTTEFTRGLGCGIETMKLKLSDLAGHPHVNHHIKRERMTLKPSALFRMSGSNISLLTEHEVPNNEGKSTDQYLSDINKLEYTCTPFYYCFDYRDNRFDVSCYYLDYPEVLSRNFIDRNYQAEILVAADLTEILKTDNGYKLKISTRSDDIYKGMSDKDLFCQLAFIPTGQSEYAYINGTMIGWNDGNPVWEFELESTYDFENNDIIFNNFKVLSKERRELPCPLEHEFRVILGIYDYGDPQPATEFKINDRAAHYLLDIYRDIKVLTENSLRIRFGHALTRLWRNARSVPALKEYKRHEEDVILTYSEDVMKIGDDGYPKYTETPEGRYEFEIEHHKGDPILDENNQPIYLHRKGDIMLNENKEPILAKPKDIVRFIDILLLDGIYRFSTSSIDKAYFDSIPKRIVDWLETDLERLSHRLLERTDLFFTPKRTMGYVKVVTENAIERTIFNRLAFHVKYYLRDIEFKNETLKNEIRLSTAKIINEVLKERTISRDVIEQKLREAAGNGSILGVQVVDMGLGENINTFTMVNDLDQCSVRRKIVPLADNTLKVREDINIEFINHTDRLSF